MNTVDQIENNIERIPFSGCWIWMGTLVGNGYGLTRNRPSAHRVSAHRASYAAYKGHIPPGMNVCHRCDVKLCVNPDHLFIGTVADNNTDKAKKGRAIKQKGALNFNAKLTEEQVRIIRSAATTKTYTELAKEFGISKTHAFQIVNHLRWKELQ